MNYFLYKLKFTTPVHFGKSDSAQSLFGSRLNVAADTLFSALCHTALEMGGTDQLDRLIEAAREGNLLLTDAFPWKNDELYLPKPLYRRQQVQKETDLSSKDRKAIKKLNWVPVSMMADLLTKMKVGDPFKADQVDQQFGTRLLNEKAAVRTGGDARPYAVGTFYFREQAGLYFIAAVRSVEDGDVLGELVEALGLSGLGGKRSSGLGKFDLEDKILLNEPFDDETRWLFDALEDQDHENLLLTTSLPKDDELPVSLQGASYLLTRRGGFVQSDHFAPEMRKKDVQYFFQAGSVFDHRFKGELYEVSGGTGCHPVYRYSRPLFLGVSL